MSEIPELRLGDEVRLAGAVAACVQGSNDATVTVNGSIHGTATVVAITGLLVVFTPYNCLDEHVTTRGEFCAKAERVDRDGVQIYPKPELPIEDAVRQAIQLYSASSLPLADFLCNEFTIKRKDES